MGVSWRTPSLRYPLRCMNVWLLQVLIHQKINQPAAI